MNKGITNRQLAFILILTLTTVTSANIPGMIAKSAGVGGWITLLATALIFAGFTVIIVKLNNRFTDQTLFEYAPKLIGKIGTYLIVIIYLVYFLAIATNLTGNLTRLLKSNFLIETPIWAPILGSIALCCYGAYKGVTNVARLIEIYAIINIGAVLFVHILMFFQGDINSILPLYIPEETGKYFSAIKETIFSFLGIEVLTIIPFSRQNKKNAGKVAFFSLIAVGLLYIVIVESSIMMVGMNEIIYHEFSMLEAIRLVELPKIEFLRRLDPLYLIVGLGGVHVGIMMVFTALVEYLTKLLKKPKRSLLCLFVGIVTFAITLLIYNIDNYDTIFLKIITIYGLVVAALIPILLFLLAKVKNNVQTND